MAQCDSTVAGVLSGAPNSMWLRYTAVVGAVAGITLNSTSLYTPFDAVARISAVPGAMPLM